MSEPVARLIEHRQARPPKVHELGLGTVSVGRVLKADIVIDHADVSRRHAELDIRPESATIRDLGSKNGVLVDGRKVSEAPLDDGSRISLGELDLVLEHSGARIARVLQQGGEPTVRRPRAPAPDPSPVLRRRLTTLGPALAVLAFALLLTLLLVYG